MSLVEKITLGVVLAFLAVAVFRLCRTPLKLALRLLVNTALGFAAVGLLNLTTAYTGLHLGMNFFNAAVIAVLGAPGFGLLLLVQWMLG